MSGWVAVVAFLPQDPAGVVVGEKQRHLGVEEAARAVVCDVLCEDAGPSQSHGDTVCLADHVPDVVSLRREQSPSGQRCLEQRCQVAGPARRDDAAGVFDVGRRRMEEGSQLVSRDAAFESGEQRTGLVLETHVHNHSCATMVVYMGEVTLENLDIATLAMLTGEAARARMTARIRALGFSGIRSAHGYVFQHLIDRAPTVGELAEQLGVTQQRASKLVSELESLGYVRRHGDPADSRVRRIALTERGTDCVAAARRLRAQWHAALARRLGTSAMTALTTGLAAFADQLGIEEPVRERRVALPPHER